MGLVRPERYFVRFLDYFHNYFRLFWFGNILSVWSWSQGSIISFQFIPKARRCRQS